MNNDYERLYSNYSDWHWWFKGRRNIAQQYLNWYGSSHVSENTLIVGGGAFEEKLLKGHHGYFTLAPDSCQRSASGTDGIQIGGSLPDLPFKSGQFDLICLFGVLEHLRRDEAALRELQRILTVGGHLILSVPAFPWLWSKHDEINHHKRRYTLASLKKKLTKRSFQLVDRTYFNTILFPLIAPIILARKILPNWIMNGDTSFFEFNRPGTVNRTLAKIFKLESTLIEYLSLPFGISLLVVVRKTKNT